MVVLFNDKYFFALLKGYKNKNIDKLGSSLFRKVKLFAWETGLGPLINVKPEIFGQQGLRMILSSVLLMCAGR